MKKILLHTCCAPCGAHVIKELQNNGFEVTCFFYNPNIFPYSEYLTRKEEIEKYFGKLNIETISSEYKLKEWFKAIKGLEQEPERGKRCEVCYRLRLEETGRLTRERGCDYFGSTLSISPHKDAAVINEIGLAVEQKLGINFYQADWKKNDGFKKSCQISRAENFYRQKYCGCIFSRR